MDIRRFFKYLTPSKKTKFILSLDGGDDGLDCYRVIAKDLKRVINKNAIIIIEIGHNQSLSVIEIFKKNNFKLIKKYNDINGLERVLTFQ